MKDTKPRLHSWFNCSEILKMHASTPYRFHQVRQTLIAECRTRAVLLLETPYTTDVSEISCVSDSLEKLHNVEPADFPQDRQLGLNISMPGLSV